LAAKELLEEAITSGEPFKVTDLAITGQDIMQHLNIPPSAAVGENLAYLMEEVIKNPALNNFNDLINLIKNRKQ